MSALLATPATADEADKQRWLESLPEEHFTMTLAPNGGNPSFGSGFEPADNDLSYWEYMKVWITKRGAEQQLDPTKSITCVGEKPAQRGRIDCVADDVRQ